MQNLYVTETIVFIDRVYLYFRGCSAQLIAYDIDKRYFSLKKKSFQFKCNPLYSTLS